MDATPAPGTTLFDPPPRNYRPPRAHARRNDPVTSHEAAVAANAKGMPSEHGMIVLQVLRDRNGLTVSEIAERCPLSREQIGRRMAELDDRAGRLGLVAAGPERRTMVRHKKRRELTWWYPADSFDQATFDRDHTAAEALHARPSGASHRT